MPVIINGKPCPDHHPTDLVTVRDIYGHRHRVRAAHLADEKRNILPRFNQHGLRVSPDSDDVNRRFIHRAYLAPQQKAHTP